MTVVDKVLFFTFNRYLIILFFKTFFLHNRGRYKSKFILLICIEVFNAQSVQNTETYDSMTKSTYF